MVQGKLRCLGSNQHLKSKFGKGYVLQLKVGQMPQVVGVTPHSRALQVPIDNEDRAIAFVQGAVPSAVVTQRHMGALSFNAEQLQVPALQLRFLGFLSFRQHAAACTTTSHFVNARISLSAMQLSDFFEKIESAKAALAVSDYSISQTTLEQVFISFVNQA